VDFIFIYHGVVRKSVISREKTDGTKKATACVIALEGGSLFDQ
jgi:hypothetical protein